eukprot:2355223-Prymnesium_polylepis.1
MTLRTPGAKLVANSSCLQSARKGCDEAPIWPMKDAHGRPRARCSAHGLKGALDFLGQGHGSLGDHFTPLNHAS